jgi:predicted site-specific integrase-resolvase
MMSSDNLLPLEAWARKVYGDFAPSIGTLRRWVRDGRIQPQPKKQGRSYFLKPEAEYK